MDFNSLAQIAIEANASRFHVVSGTVPSLQFFDRLEKMSLPRLSPPEVYAIASELLDDNSKKIFFDRLEILLRKDYSADIAFRIHIFKQRGTLGFSAKKILNRIIPVADIPVLPELLDLFRWRRGGLLIISGKANSGRTCTENSILHFLAATGSRHIVQLTDCLEGEFAAYENSFISRRIYGLDLAPTAAGIQGLNSDDIDVISLGELDNMEILETALLLAASGIFVIGTMLAPDIDITIRKIQHKIQNKSDLRSRLADSLLGVINQRFIYTAGKERFISETICVNSIVRKYLLDNNHYGLQNYLKSTNRSDCRSYDKVFKDLIAEGALTEEELPDRFRSFG